MATTTDLPHGDDSHDPLNGNDVELRELVYQTLERDGLITRLKAQLRAAVFKTIEKASNPSGALSTPAYDSQQGRVCRTLIHDWLEHARLLYTQDIFQVETSAPNRPGLLTHDQLIEQLHLDTANNRSQPLLHALLSQRSQPVRIDFDHASGEVVDPRSSPLQWPVFLNISNNPSILDFPRRRSTISIASENTFVLCSRQRLIPVCSMLFSTRRFHHRPHPSLNSTTNKSVWNGCKLARKLWRFQPVAQRNKYLARKFAGAFSEPLGEFCSCLSRSEQCHNSKPRLLCRAMVQRSRKRAVLLRRPPIRSLLPHRQRLRRILVVVPMISLCPPHWMEINLWWRRAPTFLLHPYSISISVVLTMTTMMTRHRPSSRDEMPHQQHWIDWRILMTSFEATKHLGHEQHLTS